MTYTAVRREYNSGTFFFFPHCSKDLTHLLAFPHTEQYPPWGTFSGYIQNMVLESVTMRSSECTAKIFTNELLEECTYRFNQNGKKWKKMPRLSLASTATVETANLSIYLLAIFLNPNISAFLECLSKG